MTANPTLRPVPHTILPVPHGTAEALAVVAHLSQLTDSLADDAAELSRVWRPLLGPVTDPAETYNQIRDELQHLWRLIACDWDDTDLDELPDLPKYDALTVEQAQAEAYSLTTDRLVRQIETHIRNARHRWVEQCRTQRLAGAA